jgi:hypothetical protein
MWLRLRRRARPRIARTVFNVDYERQPKLAQRRGHLARPPVRSAVAFRATVCWTWDKGCRPFPLSPLAASFLRYAPDSLFLTKPNTSCTIEVPASLRSDGVRVHPGIVFGFPPELAFSFAGIPTMTN